MNANLDAKAIERNVWQDWMRDGLMELFLGTYLLLAGVVIQADMSTLFILLMVFVPGVVKMMKKRFTYPRIGYVKFPEHDQNVGRKMGIALLAVLLALAIVVLYTTRNEKIRALYQWVPLLPAICLTFGFVITGRKTGFTRYHLMAVLVLIAGLSVPLVDLPSRMDNIALYLLVVGAILFVWGMAVFIKFLYNYPVRPDDAQ